MSPWLDKEVVRQTENDEPLFLEKNGTEHFEPEPTYLLAVQKK